MDENGKTVDVSVNITVTPKGVDGAEDKPELPEDSPIDPNDKDIIYKLDPDHLPENGEVVLDPKTGDYVYIPHPGKEDLGDDFTIIVDDGKSQEKIEIKIAGTQNFDTLEDNSKDVNVDLQNGDYQSVTQPKFGKVTVNPDGTFTYTPKPDFFGNDSFFVNVKNPDGSITKIPVNIDVIEVNDAPVASDIVIATPANVPVDGFFKATDVDGDQLTFSFVDSANPNAFKTKNGGTLTITDPLTGAYTYVPPVDSLEDPLEKITVKVSDGRGGETEFEVVLNVLGYDDATADLINVLEDGVIGDISSYIKLNGKPVGEFRIATGPQNGQVVEENGKWVYKPNQDYFGKDTFIVEVKDTNGQWVKVLVPVEVESVNDAPIGNPVTTTIAEDTEYVIKITGSDVDSNDIRFKYDDSDETRPQFGHVVFKDGQWTYVPNKDYFGTDTFKMTIYDEDGGSSLVDVTVHITPVNDAPEVLEIIDVPAMEDELTSFNLTDYLKMFDVDTPLENLTYSVTGVTAQNGKASYDPTTGIVTYEGKKDFFGTDYITVIVDDGEGGVTVVQLPVKVENVNDAPTAENENIDISVTQSGSVSGSLGVTDVDGDILIYPSTVTSKNGLTVTIDENGNFTYKPGDGYKYRSDSFEVTVKDPSGESVTVHVNVKIDPKPLDQATAKMAAFSLSDDVIDTEHQEQPVNSHNAVNEDLIFNVLSDDNLGGNTLTTVNDFTSTDHIDVSQLLSSSATSSNINEFLTVTYDANTEQAVISIDRDGIGTNYQATDLLVLNHQTTDITLDELLKNNQIII